MVGILAVNSPAILLFQFTAPFSFRHTIPGNAWCDLNHMATPVIQFWQRKTLWGRELSTIRHGITLKNRENRNRNHTVLLKANSTSTNCVKVWQKQTCSPVNNRVCVNFLKISFWPPLFHFFLWVPYLPTGCNVEMKYF